MLALEAPKLAPAGGTEATRGGAKALEKGLGELGPVLTLALGSGADEPERVLPRSRRRVRRLTSCGPGAKAPSS